MKKTIIPLFSCLFVLLPLIAYTQWQVIPTGYDSKLYSIDSYGDQTLALGTDRGIIVSRDGGNTWTFHDMDLGFGDLELSFPVLDLHLIDEQSVVVTGEISFNNDQLIYRSLDNFATWEITLDYSKPEGSFHFFQDLEFVTSQIGFAVGHPLNVIATTDGGANWFLRSDIQNATRAISMYDNTHGIAVGDRHILVNSGDLTWNQIARPEYLEAVVMVDQQTAYAGGYTGMLKTTDGGNTWSELPAAPKDVINLVADGPDLLLAGTTAGIFLSRSGGQYWEYFPETADYEITGLILANDVWWALDKSGNLLQSADLSGAKPLASYAEIHPEELQCGTTTVQLTNNGSPEWSYEWYLEGELFSTDYNTSVDFDTSGGVQLDLIAITPTGRDTFTNTVYQQVGQIPQVEVQTDYFGCTGDVFLINLDAPAYKKAYNYRWYFEGATEPFSYDTVAQVSVSQDQRVLLVASKNDCLDTTYLNFHVAFDHQPLSWEEIGAPIGPNYLEDLQFIDDQLGYAITFDGFFRTLDGGQNWQRTGKEEIGNPASMFFISPLEGFVTTGRRLWKTTDGAETFFRVPRKPDNLDNYAIVADKVYFVNDTLGFAMEVSSNSKILRTLDGGKRWEEVWAYPEFGYVNISTIRCLEETCIVSGRNSGIFKSIDYGKTWAKVENYDHWAEDALILGDNTYLIASTLDQKVPTDPQPIALRRTTDGGQTWTVNLLGVTDDDPMSYNNGLIPAYFEQLDADNFYLWSLKQFYSTRDGGACWQAESRLGRNHKRVDFLTEEIGFVGSDQEPTGPPGIHRTRPDVYFTLPYPLCLGSTVRLRNESLEKGYDEFEWYRNGELFSTAAEPEWTIDSPGEYTFTLTARQAGKEGTFTREIIIDPVPPPLEWLDEPLSFCNQKDTLWVTDLGERYGYQWKLDPAVAGHWNTDKNRFQVYWWNYGDQATVSVFGISENLCTTDTLELSLGFQQRLNQIPFLSDNPDLVCVPDGEQQTVHFGLYENTLAWGTYDWRLIDAPDDWTLTPAGNGVDLSIDHIGPYRRIGLEVKGETPCFSLTDTTYLDIYGEPEIISAPHDLYLFAGDDIVLEIEAREIPGVELRYRLYKDSYLVASSPYPKMVFQNFIAEEDEGTYYMEVDNGCQVARTEPFVIALSNHARFTVFYDRNEDGIQTLPGEPGIGTGQFLIGEDQIAFPGTTGRLDYFPEDGLGAQTITYQPAPDWKLTAGTDTYQVDLNLEAPQLFKLGVSPVETIDRVEGFLNSDPLVCNLRAQFYLTIKNTGTTLQNVNVEINAPQLGYQGNQVANGIWPGETLNRILYIPMQGVELIGDTISFYLKLSYPESGASGEILTSEYTYRDILLCAYDPNDKLVMPTGEGEERATRFGEALHYTVRFQNTGNYPARDITIRDTLDEHLDLSTFELLSTSHTLSRLVMEDRALEFIFKEIYLPDSTNNEPGSHGYISYRIHPVTDLPEFTPIENTAHIYFDQNPPIVTNTTRNTLTDGLIDAVARPEAAQLSVRIYPNPTRGELIIETTASPADRLFWRLFSPTGQSLRNGQLQSPKEQLSLDLPSGVYWLNIGNLWRKVVFF
ncbi:DUF7619 domain-containing protein [Flavilitoribacter nigricans]|uniref:DUF7619 domain-containing protein n=1 Tax=Flavilitoribacter nigricans (strain ATCC 23147 / DSM 23189 / NBRC 102662 / NCIMB 1420 / SS-2) TaxID=1122177 RepID=A0A2D0N6L9_FLAN2|nr:T9SS type A sorting domain-containing protein [Flavilitoribacter nigricans]PHN04161.1 hypothetical protein CRP01_23485 [Flavilitoribacter nigricans DSM 23189 = NBRC 102662]